MKTYIFLFFFSFSTLSLQFHYSYCDGFHTGPTASAWFMFLGFLDFLLFEFGIPFFFFFFFNLKYSYLLYGFLISQISLLKRVHQWPAEVPLKRITQRFYRVSMGYVTALTLVPHQNFIGERQFSFLPLYSLLPYRFIGIATERIDVKSNVVSRCWCVGDKYIKLIDPPRSFR